MHSGRGEENWMHSQLCDQRCLRAYVKGNAQICTDELEQSKTSKSTVHDFDRLDTYGPWGGLASTRPGLLLLSGKGLPASKAPVITANIGQLNRTI